jgi:hypothetical protein
MSPSKKGALGFREDSDFALPPSKGLSMSAVAESVSNEPMGESIEVGVVMTKSIFKLCLIYDGMELD